MCFLAPDPYTKRLSVELELGGILMDEESGYLALIGTAQLWR
jgi:hypothetical protein